MQALLRETSGYEAWDLLRARCPRLAKKIWLERMGICTAFIGRAAADRAALLDRGGEHPVLSDDLFVDNLVDMVVGAMTAPARSPAPGRAGRPAKLQCMGADYSTADLDQLFTVVVELGPLG